MMYIKMLIYGFILMCFDINRLVYTAGTILTSHWKKEDNLTVTAVPVFNTTSESDLFCASLCERTLHCTSFTIRRHAGICIGFSDLEGTGLNHFTDDVIYYKRVKAKRICNPGTQPPVIMKIEKSNIIGTKLFLSGIPFVTDENEINNRFAINFVGSKFAPNSNFGLHADFRYRYYGYYKIIIYNYNYNGVWGRESRSQLPLLPNTYFILEVRIMYDYYEIKLDDKIIMNYTASLPMEDNPFIWINGKLQIYEICYE